MTNQEIKTVGQTIATETQIGGNTAARVGGVVEGIGVALDNKDAANGYYQATISGGTITVNAPNYLLGSGGNLRIKMPSAGTTASTLTIGNASNVQLWYNGAAVSAQNTWDANEIIAVFYDGTRFMASNSQGGGGKAEKIKYNNSQSGLSADDVQEAIDETAGELTITQDETKSWTQVSGNLNLADGATAYASTTNNIVTRYIPVVAGNTYQVSGSYSGNIYGRIGFATNIPANGVSATVLFQVNFNGGFLKKYKPAADGYLSISHYNQSRMSPAVFKLIGTPIKNEVMELDSQMETAEQHIVTHNVGNDDDYDFSIGDNNSFDIVQFKEGHIKTKYFNSKDLMTAAELLVRFKGKIFGIIGDSISTFQGTMPSGYANYYTTSNLGSVNNIWWKIVCDKLGMIGTNCAWSGSLVEGNSGTSSAKAGCSTKRIQDLGRNGNPDIIMCFISCNDWRYGPDNNYTLGTWKVSDPIDVTDRTITNFREAYAVMLYKLTTTYPDARIFVCTNLDDLRRDQTSGWPSNNSNGISTHEWNQNIKEIGEALGASIIDVHSCGITFANMPNYSVDGGTHPNVAGQAMIASKVLSQLISKY